MPASPLLVLPSNYLCLSVTAFSRNERMFSSPEPVVVELGAAHEPCVARPRIDKKKDKKEHWAKYSLRPFRFRVRVGVRVRVRSVISVSFRIRVRVRVSAVIW